MFTRVLLAAALAVATMGGAQAATLDFTFTFTNGPANGGGIVTGIVRGLRDNDTRAASSVEVLTNTAGFGIGEYVGSPAFNSFTVSGGSITQAYFLSFGVNNVGPAVTMSTLDLELYLTGQIGAGLRNDPSSVNVGNNSSGLTFTRVDVTPIPVPAALPLLLGGVGALALAGRRRARRSDAPA